MKLYKFKSLEKLEYIEDILKNNQLYAANFDQLNDAMEGVYFHDMELDQSIKDSLYHQKLQNKICAMSTEMSHPLLWAHYADGFKGVCIEFEVDEHSLDIEKITYARKALILNQSSRDFYDERLKKFARKLLTRKFKEWKYEKEVRIFSNTNLINHGIEVTAVFFGVNTLKSNKEKIRKIVSPEIILYDTDFDRDNTCIKGRTYSQVVDISHTVEIYKAIS